MTSIDYTRAHSHLLAVAPVILAFGMLVIDSYSIKGSVVIAQVLVNPPDRGQTQGMNMGQSYAHYSVISNTWTNCHRHHLQSSPVHSWRAL